MALLLKVHQISRGTELVKSFELWNMSKDATLCNAALSAGEFHAKWKEFAIRQSVFTSEGNNLEPLLNCYYSLWC